MDFLHRVGHNPFCAYSIRQAAHPAHNRHDSRGYGHRRTRAQHHCPRQQFPAFRQRRTPVHHVSRGHGDGHERLQAEPEQGDCVRSAGFHRAYGNGICRQQYVAEICGCAGYAGGKHVCEPHAGELPYREPLRHGEATQCEHFGGGDGNHRLPDAVFACHPRRLA